MHMTYWFGIDLGDFLFSGYNVTTIWGLLATCLGLAALAVLYEAMKISQFRLQQFTIKSVPRTTSSSENLSLLSKVTSRTFRISSYTRCPCFKWVFEVLHWSLHTTFAYILMMAVMTYNIYITIALVIGGSLGYWVFSPALIQLKMQQFQHKQAIVECNKNCEAVLENQRRRLSTVSIVAEQLVTEINIEVHAPRDT
ncbi:high affinity copper uptake protein 1 isoform X2 [Harpegnathos saltator]|uniref:high affinity copper uptake protein 1 isoform X2 n=1 Tax=Harpegnathos saltator TaxID=610380 RepID=UPI00058F1CC5|nr:high affinity copper uptake protein 1 isoform X2 [Harpegnathos saltator]